MIVQQQNSEQFVERQFLLAELLFASGQDDEAVGEYLNYLKCCDRNEERLFQCYKNLGNIYVRMREFDLAEENYNKAYALRPNSLELRVNFGTLEIQKDRLEKALEHFRSAVHQDASCSKAWVGLALIHRSLGDHDLSYANLIAALEGKGAREMALQLLQDWAFQDQRPDRLAPIVEKLQETKDRNSSDERFLQNVLPWAAELRRDMAQQISLYGAGSKETLLSAALAPPAPGGPA